MGDRVRRQAGYQAFPASDLPERALSGALEHVFPRVSPVKLLRVALAGGLLFACSSSVVLPEDRDRPDAGTGTPDAGSPIADAGGSPIADAGADGNVISVGPPP